MPSRPAKPDDDVRGLYSGSLADFIANRQALAKELRQAKDPRAAEVAKLRKPTPSAWAVNQLFAREARGMAALVGAGERARAGMRRAGDAKSLREALKTIGVESQRLAALGVERLVAEGGGAPGAAIVERLRTNLEALALDPAAAAVAERGWLDADLERPGFEVLAGLQIAAAGGAEAGGEAKPAARAAKGATVHRLEDGRKAAVERKEREQRERIDGLKSELERAETNAKDAAREAEATAKASEAAEQRASEARAAATRARQRAASAEDAVKRAREELARVERAK